MLVLARKKDASIVLTLPTGETITVKVLSIKGNTTRLGIAASKRVEIRRGEVGQQPSLPEKKAAEGEERKKADADSRPL